MLTLSIGSTDEILQSDELGVENPYAAETWWNIATTNLIIHAHVNLWRISLYLGIGALTNSTLYV